VSVKVSVAGFGASSIGVSPALVDAVQKRPNPNRSSSLSPSNNSGAPETVDGQPQPPRCPVMPMSEPW